MNECVNDWIFNSEYLEVESTLDTLEDSVQVELENKKN